LFIIAISYRNQTSAREYAVNQKYTEPDLQMWDPGSYFLSASLSAVYSDARPVEK